MTLVELSVLSAAGLFCGIVNTLAGGGSLLTLPLMIFLGVPPTLANAANRPALVAQNLLAFQGFAKSGIYRDASVRRLLPKIVFWGLAGSMVGAGLGVALHFSVRGHVVFQGLLALLLFATALGEFFRNSSKSPGSEKPLGADDAAANRELSAWFFFGLGLYMGFIQAGVGFLVMSVLRRISDWNLAKVNAVKIVFVGSANTLALIIFSRAMEIPWTVAGALALGQALGGAMGSRISVRMKESRARRLFSGLLVLFGVLLVARLIAA